MTGKALCCRSVEQYTERSSLLSRAASEDDGDTVAEGLVVRPQYELVRQLAIHCISLQSLHPGDGINDPGWCCSAAAWRHPSVHSHL
jgi:hypothetical protein